MTNKLNPKEFLEIITEMSDAAIATEMNNVIKDFISQDKTNEEYLFFIRDMRDAAVNSAAASSFVIVTFSSIIELIEEELGLKPEAEEEADKRREGIKERYFK